MECCNIQFELFYDESNAQVSKYARPLSYFSSCTRTGLAETNPTNIISPSKSWARGMESCVSRAGIVEGSEGRSEGRGRGWLREGGSRRAN